MPLMYRQVSTKLLYLSPLHFLFSFFSSKLFTKVKITRHAALAYFIPSSCHYYCLIHHFWLMWLAVSLGAYFIYLFKSLMTKKIRTLLFFRASLRLLCFPFPLPRPVFCHHHHL